MLKIRVFILLLSIILNSCNSQDTSTIDISGNWFNYSNSDESTLDESFYVEIYIDEKNFNYYNKFSGLLPSINYSIEGSIIDFNLPNTHSGSDRIVLKKIDNNTFTLSNEDGTVLTYKRIEDDKMLDLFLQNKIDENVYFTHFLERKLKFSNRKK